MVLVDEERGESIEMRGPRWLCRWVARINNATLSSIPDSPIHYEARSR